MIRETLVDGVPTFFVQTAGPTRAGLMFRVGRADETLATAGITHLVEHLALHRHGLTDYHYNGTTAAWFTHFVVEGTPEQVAEYLAGVCKGLTGLPMERVEAEKSILRTEAARRSAGGVGYGLPLWRYGAQGPGLLSYPEWGLLRLTPHEIATWAASWFTRDNAVLWLTGPEFPEQLSLPLAAGARMPLPQVTSVVPSTPAYYAEGQGGIVLNALVDRGPAAQVFAGMLERELFRRLRQDGGYSYTADASLDPRAGERASITAYADAQPQQEGAVVGGFLDALAALAYGEIGQSEIDAMRQRVEQGLAHPDYDAATLPTRVADVLLDRPNPSVEETRAGYAAVTAADVRTVAIDALSTALIQVPRGHQLDWAGFEEAPGHSGAEVAGRRFLSRSADGCSVVVGSDGVSVTSPAGPATVRYRDCVAMLTWPDGARRLIGIDGIQAHIEPTMFEIDKSELAEIDSSIPPPSTVRMPARDESSIPRPTIAKRPYALKKPLRSFAVSAVVTTLLTVMMIQFGNAWTPEDGSLAEKALLWLFFGCAASFVWSTASLINLVRHWQRARQAHA